jgi:hypothetical protein
MVVLSLFCLTALGERNGNHTTAAHAERASDDVRHEIATSLRASRLTGGDCPCDDDSDATIP